ncbi:solute carrier family 41 member 2 [Morone saxatilis]|uniref:solute carrier family 41 member 2 n=1 Tax=Morone saxatilis TaxID=34816 RepID=UPI0015E1BEB8|nr:solute carrier family 41 member 2 [Morone saxatilis]
MEMSLIRSYNKVNNRQVSVRERKGGMGAERLTAAIFWRSCSSSGQGRKVRDKTGRDLRSKAGKIRETGSLRDERDASAFIESQREKASLYQFHKIVLSSMFNETFQHYSAGREERGYSLVGSHLMVLSIGGLILDKTVSDPNLAGILVYAPVINGIGGNLVSIQSSRISTNLHLNYSPREVPEDRRSCYNPCRTFLGSGANHRSAQILLLLVIPGQLVFVHTIHLMKGGHTLPSPLFTIAFLSASLIQVFSLLCIADCMVHCLWRRGKDPDSYSIPYLTALGDLFGTALLSLAFLMLWCIGDSGSV